MGRILAIDYGTARVGLAISDALKITAQSLETVNINNDDDLFINVVEDLVKKYNVDTIVIGYPKHMSGDLSETSKKIDNLIPNLEKICSNIVKWDERLTTVMAHKTMKELGIKQVKKKEHADRLAAMYILQDYLSYIS
ncbi:MAG: Holliday junction resolvase RuvX [Clostridia bacterium]|nr:Holliday junction resolvase RuvX [Clostridia bacterium]